MTDETTTTEVVNAWRPDDSNDAPQIHRAMFAAKLDMPSIAKNGSLDMGGKSVPFTKIDDIRKALYPILAKHGIMVYPVYVDGSDEMQVAQEPMTLVQFDDELDAEGKKTGKKILAPSREVRDGRIPTTRFWSTVVYDIQFVYVGDGSGVVVRTKGLAYDTNSDKAVGKATTAAVKRAFVETFDIVDGAEPDENASDTDPSNRAATTDRREGGDRGQQQRAAATGQAATGSTRRSGPQRSASTRPSPAAARAKSEAEEAAGETGADPSTGEVPEPEAPPAESELDKAKARVREAVATLGYDPATVNAIATEVTGKAERSEWIVLPTAVKKLADELEKRVKAEGLDATGGYRDETPY